jgi:tuftelin-interacting protein 11
VVNIRHEKEKSDEIVAYEEKQMEKLKRILELVERFEMDKNEGKMNLKDCGDMLLKLQRDFPDEYKIYDLWALSIALVFPLMKKEFDDWDPLKYPQKGISIIREWKKILEDPINRPYQGGEPHMEPYERLIWEVWMPPVRKATTEWVTRQPDNIIDVLDAWLELLPEWIVNNILEQIILPRLQLEVENWNPLTDTVPIHAWLHPWLPLMHDRLEPLYAPIRQKLSNALVNWHPSDPSAKLILEPWHGVFKDGHMNAFLLKNIMPKLMLCMQEFVINPHQQHLDAWNWVMAWQKLLPRIQMVTLLLKHFFPKWLQVLSTWLGSNPNFDEITKWYSGWKSMFSESLLSESQVKEEFNKALEMMNRAASGLWTPRDNMAYLQRPEGRSSPRPNPIPPLMPDTNYPGVKTVSGSNSLPGSFKDLVEKKAEANNLLFAPMPNKTWEAKQLYTFGKSQIYIDQGVVFRFDNMFGQFLPISLNTLIEKSK